MSTLFFQCEICQKNYASSQSLCNHRRNIHKLDNMVKVSLNKEKGKSKVSQEVTSTITTKETYKCKYCDKIYKHKQSRSKHYKKCELSHNIIINDLQTQVTELEQKIAQIITPNSQSPTISSHINNGIINNTINNGTINNNYIIKFGTEDLSTILSKEDMIKICNKKFSSIEESIKMTHFNKDKPELNNVIIKNLRDAYAYIHDGDEYIVQTKNDIISDLIELHLDNIEMIVNEDNENNIRNKLDYKVIKKLENIRDRLDDESEVKINEKKYDNYKSYKINQIKILIYNCIRKLKIIMNKN